MCACESYLLEIKNPHKHIQNYVQTSRNRSEALWMHFSLIFDDTCEVWLLNKNWKAYETFKVAQVVQTYIWKALISSLRLTVITATQAHSTQSVKP